MEPHAFMGQRDLASLFFLLLEVGLILFLGCWITPEFSVQRTVADFMWMWISAFSSLLAYIALFLVLKGYIVVDGWRILWTYGQDHPVIPQSSILAYKMLA
jgi:hypothetical protein